MKTITLKDFEKIKTAATRKSDTIPKGHCRIKEETYHRAIIDGCNGAKERKPGRAVYMVVNVGYNQGIHGFRIGYGRRKLYRFIKAQRKRQKHITVIARLAFLR